MKQLFESPRPYMAQGARPGGASGDYSYWTLSVRQAVRCAVDGKWEMPAFQRSYVWKPSQVCDLADSLWHGYPVGFFLLWDDRRPAAGQPPHLWIADGHQRLTSLCLLFGQPPRWWRLREDREGARLMRRYAVHFDLEASQPPFFAVPGESDAGRGHLVSVPDLLALELDNESDRSEFQRIVDAAVSRRRPEPQRCEIEQRLRRVCAIGERSLLATVVAHRRAEEVLEVFQRLNSRGMRFRRLLLKLLMQRTAMQIKLSRRSPAATEND